MNLKVLKSAFSVVQYPSHADIPDWAIRADWISITRTDEELSIVCPTEELEQEGLILQVEHDWCALKIEGPLAFELVGILESITKPLAEHQISIYALSTYNTDYVLIKKAQLEKAIEVLQEQGHQFV